MIDVVRQEPLPPDQGVGNQPLLLVQASQPSDGLGRYRMVALTQRKEKLPRGRRLPPVQELLEQLQA